MVYAMVLCSSIGFASHDLLVWDAIDSKHNPVSTVVCTTCTPMFSVHTLRNMQKGRGYYCNVGDIFPSGQTPNEMSTQGCLPCAQAFGEEEGEAADGQPVQRLEPEWEPSSGQTVNQRALQWAAPHLEGSPLGGGPCKPADMIPGPHLPWVHQPLGKLECLQKDRSLIKMRQNIHCP